MRISDWGSDVGSSDLTVRLQVGLAAKRAEFDNTEEVLSELGLMPYADRLAGDISYGDQRRVDLALTLVGRPKVLLLDEPAAGLTLEESLSLARMLRVLAEQRSEEHTSELQSLMRISYAVFCLKKKKTYHHNHAFNYKRT